MTSHPQEQTPGQGRYNIYYAVHKGLRLGHGRMLAALGANDFTDGRTTARLVAELRGFLGLAKRHLDTEETEIHTALESRKPGITAHAHEDHEDHENAFAELEDLVRAVEDLPPGQRPAAGDRLYRRYALFAAADLRHMHGEETQLLQVMHELFSDQELRGIEGRIVGKSTPEAMIGFMRLIMPALNPRERLAMLIGMQGGMPPERFATLLRDAVKPSISAEDFDAVIAALGLRAAA